MKNKNFASTKFRFYSVRSFVFIIFLVFLCSIVFTSCTQYQEIKNSIVRKFAHEEEMDNAIEVVKNFFDALIGKDYDSAYGYICSEDKKYRTLEDFNNDLGNVTDIISIEINWVEVKNNIAVVGIDLTDFYDGEEKMYKDIEVSLVKEENGSWKIKYWD